MSQSNAGLVTGLSSIPRAHQLGGGSDSCKFSGDLRTLMPCTHKRKNSLKALVNFHASNCFLLPSLSSHLPSFPLEKKKKTEKYKTPSRGPLDMSTLILLGLLYVPLLFLQELK